jgi:hypothetical protein
MSCSISGMLITNGVSSFCVEILILRVLV